MSAEQDTIQQTAQIEQDNTPSERSFYQEEARPPTPLLFQLPADLAQYTRDFVDDFKARRARDEGL